MVNKMDKKMKGVADPFTLGIIIALLGSISAATLTGNKDHNVAQNASGQSSDTTIMAINEEADE